MVTLKINGQQVTVPEKTTIMEAAEKVGIHIPHLCFLKGINEIGACRVCLVELTGIDRLVTACDTECRSGMEVITNSPRLRRIRRINVDLILSDHRSECPSCVKSGNCTLQSIANDLGLIVSPFEVNTAEKSRWDNQLPLIRDASKCVKCMRCIQVCEKIQGLSVWDLHGTGRGLQSVSEKTDLLPISTALCAVSA